MSAVLHGVDVRFEVPPEWAIMDRVDAYVRDELNDRFGCLDADSPAVQFEVVDARSGAWLVDGILLADRGE